MVSQRPPIQRIQIRNTDFCCKRPLRSPQTTREPNQPKSENAAYVRTLQIVCDQSCDWSLCKWKNSILTHLARLSSKGRAAKWWIWDFISQNTMTQSRYPPWLFLLSAVLYTRRFTRIMHTWMVWNWPMSCAVKGTQFIYWSVLTSTGTLWPVKRNEAKKVWSLWTAHWDGYYPAQLVEPLTEVTTRTPTSATNYARHDYDPCITSYAKNRPCCPSTTTSYKKCLPKIWRTKLRLKAIISHIRFVNNLKMRAQRKSPRHLNESRADEVKTLKSYGSRQYKYQHSPKNSPF